jgi:hypothetical protein
MKQTIDKLTAADAIGDIVVPEAGSVRGAERPMAETGAREAPARGAAGRVGMPLASGAARRLAVPVKPAPAVYWTEWQMKGAPHGG